MKRAFVLHVILLLAITPLLAFGGLEDFIRRYRHREGARVFHSSPGAPVRAFLKDCTRHHCSLEFLLANYADSDSIHLEPGKYNLTAARVFPPHKTPARVFSSSPRGSVVVDFQNDPAISWTTGSASFENITFIGLGETNDGVFRSTVPGVLSFANCDFALSNITLGINAVHSRSKLELVDCELHHITGERLIQASGELSLLRTTFHHNQGQLVSCFGSFCNITDSNFISSTSTDRSLTRDSLVWSSSGFFSLTNSNFADHLLQGSQALVFLTRCRAAVIQNVIFHDSILSGEDTYGITAIDNVRFVSIDNVTFTQNSAITCVYMGGKGSYQLSRVDFFQNFGDSLLELSTYSGYGRIIDSSITLNSITNYQDCGAIRIRQFQTLELVNVTIEGNAGGAAPIVMFDLPACTPMNRISIMDCKLDNNAGLKATGVWFYDSLWSARVPSSLPSCFQSLRIHRTELNTSGSLPKFASFGYRLAEEAASANSKDLSVELHVLDFFGNPIPHADTCYYSFCFKSAPTCLEIDGAPLTCQEDSGKIVLKGAILCRQGQFQLSPCGQSMLPFPDLTVKLVYATNWIIVGVAGGGFAVLFLGIIAFVTATKKRRQEQ